MLPMILAAILSISTAKPAAAQEYASTIVTTAGKAVDPFLVVAIIHAETGTMWNPEMVSPSDDYGLMQVHVGKGTGGGFKGQEKELLVPKTNIAAGVAILLMWKKYHNTKCRGQRHHWWSHYKWGRVVKNDIYGKKIEGIYKSLKKRFDGKRICLGGPNADSDRRLRCIG